MSKGIYVGKLTSVPIYGTEVTSIPFSLENFESFFYKENTSSDDSIVSFTENEDYVRLLGGGSGKKLSSVKLTALYDISNIEIKYYYYSSAYPLTIKLNGTTQHITASTKISLSSIVSLNQGDVLEISLRYISTARYCPYVMIKCNDLSIENTIITGYEDKEVARKVSSFYTSVNSVARKITKGYVGVNGVARLFYDNSAAFKYTGDYTEREDPITLEGTQYKLYTLTSSGELSLPKDSLCWLCGGGGSGGRLKAQYSAVDGGSSSSILTHICSGGGGGGGFVNQGSISSGNYAVQIGGGGTLEGMGGTTSIGNLEALGGYSGWTWPKGTISDNGSGGSSGGSGFMHSLYYEGTTVLQEKLTVGGVGAGSGQSTIPFGLQELQAHSAGGGAGAIQYRDKYNTLHYYAGGDGGSNGGTGSEATKVTSPSYAVDGIGGSIGGGQGYTYDINLTAVPTYSNATFFGGGGGGTGGGTGEKSVLAFGDRISFNSSYPAPGAGYQGVVYLLVPV